MMSKKQFSIGSLLFWVLPILLLIWWRGHTFGPAVYKATGLRLWPVLQGASEPLDCDEAAYGYMGRRQAEGASLYKDLTEYKPPGGYWFYGLAMAAGGASEMTVRLMIIPVLLANLVLVGLILKQWVGKIATTAGMIVFIFLSTDPYVYGNGSNLEHLMNLGLTASLFAVLNGLQDIPESGAGSGGHYLRLPWIVLAGACVGVAATVKQVCLLGLIPLLYCIYQYQCTTRLKRFAVFWLGLGFGLPWLIAGGILALQGALDPAWQDVIVYSRALAADTPPDTNAPPGYYRWLTGNADPRNGRLPWPFGRTDWLVWWGTGSWPIVLITALVAIFYLWQHREPGLGDGGKITAVYWLTAWVMIILPGLYWQHYYMLLGPPMALLIGLVLGQVQARFKNSKIFVSRLGSGLIGACVLASMMTFFIVQYHSYLMVPAEQLTVKYKGGAQWVSLKALGEDIRKRVAGWPERPLLEVWGWQSPLLFYSGLDAPGRYFFTDPLMKAHIQKGHPQTTPRLAELEKDLQKNRPELIFCGDVPFASLKKMLDRDYLPSSLVPNAPDGRGFFIRKDRYQAFHQKPLLEQ